jgi:hypothetical protein
MQQIRWTDHVKSEEVLHRVREERSILLSVNKEVRLTGLVAPCIPKCIQRNDVEETTEGTGRRGRRSRGYWMSCWKIEDNGN